MTIGNHIFWPMGMDMEYQNAVKWFKNMDKLIHYSNQAGQLNVLYSTLGHYTDLKLQDKHTQWTIKTDDFFPYANERFGYCGTEKQLVADDYALRVSEGVESGTARLSQLFPSQSVALCLLANVSVCAPSALRPFTFVVYNHLTSVHTYTVTLPFRAKNVHVRLANGSTVPSAVVPFVSVYGKVPLKHQAPNTLVVETLLPPLGWVAYHVVPGKENPHPPSKTWYTDSNGLEFVKRVRDYRETWNLTLHNEEEKVAANYVPITIATYIRDKSNQFNVITDRAQGAASLKDGKIQFYHFIQRLGQRLTLVTCL
ncbi:hypothetical protein DYB34_010732 [Aphanomyces astaci]|uniref:Glycosyl hydrolase family 38 C-terminal domain-containing protein n=1 Tax=Aphanomyces astaci TaxID=112090 RepID=A0A3R7AFC2_APHAT|nr:hypothetical protein DYB34_010732 [Aphanomyces astaci]